MVSRAVIPACLLSFTLAASGLCQAQGGNQANPKDLERTIAELQQQNTALQKSLAEARKGEEESRTALNRVKLRLEALGHNLLDGGEDRLVQAASDLQVLNERIRNIEGASTRLRSVISDYLRKAVVSDPDARLRVETSLRELDAALGLGQKPRPDVQSGTLHQARVVSIDRESGLLVLNVGETEGVKIGMTFRLLRGERLYGTAIVADVRKNVCGMFVETLQQENDRVRLGDAAILETE